MYYDGLDLILRLNALELNLNTLDGAEELLRDHLSIPISGKFLETKFGTGMPLGKNDTI
jgi:hypothetical protein